MAVTQQGFLAAAKSTVLSLNATLREIVADGTVVLYGVEIDNSENNVDVFFKAWFEENGVTSTEVTLGTTDPNLVIRVKAGSKLAVPWAANGAAGRTIDDGNSPAPDSVDQTGLTVACVTTGGTSGTGGPPNDVPVVVYTN